MFNQKQIEELLNNKNVVKCSPKSITYNNKFKLEAIRKYYDKGYSPKIIFEEAGFNLSWIGKDKPKQCLKRWKDKYRQGKGALIKENRGGPGRRSKHINKDSIEYLKTKIAYLEAENDFLAKLRGLKRK